MTNNSPFIEEFLFRGQPDGTGVWHVVLGAVASDGFGGTTINLLGPMTPEAAVAQGVTLATVSADINAAALAATTTAQTALTAEQATNATLTTQLTTANGQVELLTGQLAAASTEVRNLTAQVAALQAQIDAAAAGSTGGSAAS